MKILWISHDPVREPKEFGQSSSGFWKEALLKLLIDNSGISIKVAFPGKKCSKTVILLISLKVILRMAIHIPVIKIFWCH